MNCAGKFRVNDKSLQSLRVTGGKRWAKKVTLFPKEGYPMMSGLAE